LADKSSDERFTKLPMLSGMAPAVNCAIIQKKIVKEFQINGRRCQAHNMTAFERVKTETET
jgi:hypothetical protein